MINWSKSKASGIRFNHQFKTHKAMDLLKIRYMRVLKRIKPDLIVICNKDISRTLAGVMAAIDLKISFCVLEPEDNLLYPKLLKADPDLILSDFHIINSEFYLTFDTRMNKMLITEKYKALHSAIIEEEYHKVFIPNENAVWISFENYLTDRTVVSNEIKISQVEKGINKWRLVGYKSTDNVLYYESLNSVQDVVNGILAPILTGANITFSIPHSYVRKNKYKLYTSIETLEKTLRAIWKSSDSSNKLYRDWKLFRLKHNLKRSLRANIKKIVLNREYHIDNRLLWLSQNLLSSFDTIELITNKRIGSYLTIDGKTVMNDYINVKSKRVGQYGNIHAHCVDSYIQEGLFNTGYIGEIDSKNIIHIIGNSSYLIDFYYNKLVEIGRITNKVFDQPYVANCQIVCDANGNLIMLIEPDAHVCESRGWDFNKLNELIFDLQCEIDLLFRDGAYIKLEIYTGSLNLQAYKLIEKIIQN